jgi:molybdenum cofactor cytidylyltransferase
MAVQSGIVEIVRSLRKLQTPEEKELWERLRNRKLKRLKFLRQHPIIYSHVEGKPQFFVADFYCAEKKLVIELDGKIHDFQKDYDANRDSILNQLGLQVLRIKNDELSNVYSVLKKITSLTHPPSPSLQSREGVVSRSETGGELVILILAAGSSSRMGKSKQLLIIDDKPLLLKAVDIAFASNLGNIVVVLGAHAKEHEEIMKHRPVDIVFNPDWKNGMGSSLKAGVKHIQHQYAQLKGILVMVCDQPFLTAEHLNKLVEAHRESGKPIVASSYSNIIGIPCFFDSAFISNILSLGDEEGAKRLLQVYSQDVVSVEFPKGEVDLDTPEDLQKIDSGH